MTWAEHIDADDAGRKFVVAGPRAWHVQPRIRKMPRRNSQLSASMGDAEGEIRLRVMEQIGPADPRGRRPGVVSQMALIITSLTICWKRKSSPMAR